MWGLVEGSEAEVARCRGPSAIRHRGINLIECGPELDHGHRQTHAPRRRLVSHLEPFPAIPTRSSTGGCQQWVLPTVGGATSPAQPAEPAERIIFALDHSTLTSHAPLEHPENLRAESTASVPAAGVPETALIRASSSALDPTFQTRGLLAGC